MTYFNKYQPIKQLSKDPWLGILYQISLEMMVIYQLSNYIAATQALTTNGA